MEDRSIIKRVYLVASSKQQAFYQLFLEVEPQSSRAYVVRKVSGARGTVYDQREWRKEKLADAERLYEKKIAEKTNPNRKSIRKYTIIS